MHPTIKAARVLAVALVLSLFGGKLAFADGPAAAVTASSPVRGASQSTVSKPPPGSGNLCAANERTVFSCILEVNRKSVSLCASSDLNYFYYIAGQTNAPELIFPSKNKSARIPFTRTLLDPETGEAGYAFTFINGDFEYIIYSITYSIIIDKIDKAAGMIIRRPHHLSSMEEMSCRPNSIFEAHDKDISDIIRKWPINNEIQKDNLPLVD